MAEVLKLSYNAFGPSITVQLDAIGPHGGTVIGPPKPERHLTMKQLTALDGQLADDFASFLKRLEPLVRAKTIEDESDPIRVREEANGIARARADLEQATATALRAVDAAKAERERIEEEARMARAEHEAEMKRLVDEREAEMKRLEALRPKKS